MKMGANALEMGQTPFLREDEMEKIKKEMEGRRKEKWNSTMMTQCVHSMARRQYLIGPDKTRRDKKPFIMNLFL